MQAAYMTPAITLFHEDGSLDLENQGALYENLIRHGMDGILVQGSIGEFFAMPMFQRMQLAKFAVDTIARRTKCIIGTASMFPEEIAPYSNCCLDMGADAVMLLSPYYFGLDDAALFEYYDRLLGQVNGAVYLYNFPDRTGYTITPDTVLRLADRHSNLIGIKDTVSGMDHTRELIKTVKCRFPYFEVYSGLDDNAAHNVLSGGNGCIGGLSNVVPELCAAWIQAMREDNVEGIAQGQQRMDRLMDIYSVSSLFVPILKEGVRLREITGSANCTFPMSVPTPEQDAKIAEILAREGMSVQLELTQR